MTLPRRYSIYGVDFASDHAFSIPLAETGAEPALEFRLSVDPGAGLALTPQADETKLEELFRGTATFDDGRPLFRILTLGDGLLVRYEEVADFHLHGSSITARVLDPAFVPACEIYFLGTVLSVWFEWRGALVLHGAAVSLAGKAAVFLGDKGAGKTTLTCGLLVRGAGLIADDLTVCADSARPWVPAAYPRLRLWPEQAEALLQLRNLPPILEGDDKRWAPVPPGSAGFMARGAPLGTVYLLDRTEEARPVEIEPLGSAESVVTMVRHSFVPNVAQALGLAPGRLQRFTEIAHRFPVHALRYGGPIEALGDVCDAVLQHARDRSAVPGSRVD
ncbi:MAG: hypothetical protein HKO53_20435 [Gemmatimonadetes bacterium]|nr:hypothetical protein [Gemmatimonadota bacterium]